MNKERNIILFDSDVRNDLLPLTFTKPVSELRIGITTLKEKWERAMQTACSYLTIGYLSEKFSVTAGDNNLYVNASVIATPDLAKTIEGLKPKEMLVSGDMIIAFRSNTAVRIDSIQRHDFKELPFRGKFDSIRYPWDLFSLNDTVLRSDFKALTAGRKSQKLSASNLLLGAENIFVEEGARCEGAILNALTGPIYIGREAEIMEGSVVRGPLALCGHATLKLAAKIYGATTIGPYCKVGGEVNNSIFTGYSSKAHDGFLGNAVIGEWCNLGADTNNSNLKNNYASVKLWNYPKERFIDTGLQFCGLIMGDHSKCGINTMFNTGTIVGVSVNIFGAGFPRNFIPSFSWGGAGGFTVYKPEKALETAEIAMQRRNIKLSEEDRSIFHQVFKLTEKYRNF